MTTSTQPGLERATIGDNTRPRSRVRKRPVWMERPHPVVQVLKFLALLISIAWSSSRSGRSSPPRSPTSGTINASGGGMVMWPKGVTFSSYVSVLSGGVVTRAMLISIGITVVGTVVSLATTAGLAYWLSRPRAAGAKPMLMLVLGAVLFTPA